MTVSFNDTLERFNRKERNLLIRTVLGHSQDARIPLSRKFCDDLTGVLELRETNPADVRWWTDYHLNWLVAALRIFGDEAAVGMPQIRNSDIESNLEDLDLLVGIERPERYLIAIEAKNRRFNIEDRIQLKRKLNRLDPLRRGFADIEIGLHFMLMTPPSCDPNMDKGLKEELKGWPWVYKHERIPWLPLMHCDAEQPLRLECSCFGPDRRDGMKDHWRCTPERHRPKARNSPARDI